MDDIRLVAELLRELKVRTGSSYETLEYSNSVLTLAFARVRKAMLGDTELRVRPICLDEYIEQTAEHSLRLRNIFKEG